MLKRHLSHGRTAYKSNSEILTRILFSRKFAHDEITLSFTDTFLYTHVGRLCPSRDFLTSRTCRLPLFAKIKILAKVSEFTVLCWHIRFMEVNRRCRPNYGIRSEHTLLAIMEFN